MKQTLLLGITGITLIALTATTLYAQTVAGTSLVDKMKAVAHTFTLSADLNPGQTGFESAPIAGKKTGNMLTAGEWNRVLELLGQGGTWGTPGWENVQLTDTNPFDRTCEYRFYMNAMWLDAIYYVNVVAPTTLVYISHNSVISSIPSNNKTSYQINWSPAYTVSKIEKLCGGGGETTTITGGGLALYKCTNAQSLDTTNFPCYGASRNGGAGTNQYRVVSCTDNDGIRSYTMSSILNFWQLATNKWAVSVNGGTIECDDGTVLVMDITGSSSTGTSPSNIVYINPDNTSFTPLTCTPGVNYMITPIAFSADSASSFTTRKVAVLGAGNWQVKGTGFVRIRNKNPDVGQALRVSSVLDGTTTHLLDNSVDAGMYANSFLDPVSVPAGKTTELRVSVKNNTLHWGNIVAWCN